jgi:hypothetical protein
MSDKEALNTALLDLYQRTKDETGYNPTIFFKMLCDRGGLQTAKDWQRLSRAKATPNFGNWIAWT